MEDDLVEHRTRETSYVVPSADHLANFCASRPSSLPRHKMTKWQATMLLEIHRCHMNSVEHFVNVLRFKTSRMNGDQA